MDRNFDSLRENDMAFIKAESNGIEYEINTDFIKYAVRKAFNVVVTTIDDYEFNVSLKEWNEHKGE